MVSRFPDVPGFPERDYHSIGSNDPQPEVETEPRQCIGSSDPHPEIVTESRPERPELQIPTRDIAETSTVQRPHKLRLGYPYYIFSRYKKYLVQVEGTIGPRLIASQTVTMGRNYRSPDIDIPLVDSYLSRLTADIFFKDGQFFVRNYSENSDIIVDTYRVRAGRNVAVWNGSRIRFDNLKFGELFKINYIEFVCHVELSMPTADTFEVHLYCDEGAPLFHGVLKYAISRAPWATRTVADADEDETTFREPYTTHVRIVRERQQAGGSWWLTELGSITPRNPSYPAETRQPLQVFPNDYPPDSPGLFTRSSSFSESFVSNPVPYGGSSHPSVGDVTSRPYNYPDPAILSTPAYASYDPNVGRYGMGPVHPTLPYYQEPSPYSAPAYGVGRPELAYIPRTAQPSSIPPPARPTAMPRPRPPPATVAQPQPFTIAPHPNPVRRLPLQSSQEVDDSSLDSYLSSLCVDPDSRDSDYYCRTNPNLPVQPQP